MENKYIGYDYKEVMAESSKASFLLDSYRNFGWELDGNRNSYVMDVESRTPHINSKVRLQLKRDRNIINKMELTRLQRNFESCVWEIERLEKSKTSTATIYALVIGIMGTVFMAGSVFAVTATPPHIALCIILAIPAFIGWMLPYLIYKKKVKEKEEVVSQLVEMKYNEIHEICEKGKRLLP